MLDMGHCASMGELLKQPLCFFSRGESSVKPSRGLLLTKLQASKKERVRGNLYLQSHTNTYFGEISSGNVSHVLHQWKWREGLHIKDKFHSLSALALWLLPLIGWMVAKDMSLSLPWIDSSRKFNFLEVIAGLQIRDMQGRWLLVDGDLGPQDILLYPGLALYEATAGYISPTLHRTNIGSLQGDICGRYSLSFKLMSRASAILHCSAMTAADHGVGVPFQQPIDVHDFIQRIHPMNQLISQHGFMNFPFPVPSDGSMKSAMKRRKQIPRSKPLAPSKRLRLEAQRVLKERVQEIADRKGPKKKRSHPT